MWQLVVYHIYNREPGTFWFSVPISSFSFTIFQPELPDELFDWEDYWEDYLFEGDADDEDISILFKVCYINANTLFDLIND